MSVTILSPSYCICCLDTKDLRPFLDPDAGYSDIIKDFFMIKMFPNEVNVSDVFICAACAQRLNEAKQFKQQLLQSTLTLETHRFVKTKRGKGGYLFVRRVKPNISDEYVTEVLDEDLLSLDDIWNDQVENVEVPYIEGDNFEAEQSIIHAHDTEQSYNIGDESILACNREQDEVVESIVEPLSNEQDEVVESIVEPLSNEQDEVVESIVEPLSNEQDEVVESMVQPITNEQDKIGETMVEPHSNEQDEVEEIMLEPFNNEQDEVSTNIEMSKVKDKTEPRLLNVTNVIAHSQNIIIASEDIHNKNISFDITKDNEHITKAVDTVDNILHLDESNIPIEESDLNTKLDDNTYEERDVHSNIMIKVEKIDNHLLDGIEIVTGNEIEKLLNVFQIETPKTQEKEKRITVRKRKRKFAATLKEKVTLYSVTPDLSCEHCGQVLPNLKMFHKHMNVHFPNHVCETCGKGFLSVQRLKRHIPSHERGTFKCNACEAVFTNYNTMNSHRQRKHREVKLYKCTVCDERFLTFHRRMLHLADVHGQTEKKYKCQMCPMQFLVSGNLSAHMRRIHLKIKRYTCQQCDAGFYLKQDLQSHSSGHTGARDFACPLCDKSYPRKSTLAAHQRIHSDDRRFVCNECGKKFVQKITLKCHLKVHERRKEGVRL